jgi:hypothetical protein
LDKLVGNGEWKANYFGPLTRFCSREGEMRTKAQSQRVGYLGIALLLIRKDPSASSETHCHNPRWKGRSIREQRNGGMDCEWINRTNESGHVDDLVSCGTDTEHGFLAKEATGDGGGGGQRESDSWSFLPEYLLVFLRKEKDFCDTVLVGMRANRSIDPMEHCI